MLCYDNACQVSRLIKAIRNNEGRGDEKKLVDSLWREKQSEEKERKGEKEKCGKNQ